jgi:alpha/beta superfamily hydrolase
MLAVIEQVAPEGHLALAGFSFGAFVTSHVAQALHGQRPLDKLVLVGTAASRFSVAPVAPELHERTLVIHGEQDDTVALASVMDWARPQTLLKSLVVRHLQT